MFIFLICLLVTIIVHELAHMLVALKCGVGVKAFSIGFGKSLFHKKIKGIDFRLSPVLVGGYCDIKGMDSKKEPDDFLSQRYYKKLAILVAGVVANFLLACLCYWLNYGSITFGMIVDFELMRFMITKDYVHSAMVILGAESNLFLLQLSLLNILCAVTNFLPFPALDGGHIWLVLMEKVWKKNFVKYYLRITAVGFYVLMVLQALLAYWIIFKLD